MSEQSIEHHWVSLRGETVARDPFAADTPQLQDVLDALNDPDCQTIINHVEEPMTASELVEACEIPLSTMYRKLELLSEASLLEEQIEVRTDGRHTTRYELGFEEVRVGLDSHESGVGESRSERDPLCCREHRQLNPRLSARGQWQTSQPVSAARRDSPACEPHCRTSHQACPPVACRRRRQARRRGSRHRRRVGRRGCRR